MLGFGEKKVELQKNNGYEPRMKDLEGSVVELSNLIAEMRLQIARLNGKLGGRPKGSGQEIVEQDANNPIVYSNGSLFVTKDGKVHNK